MAIQGRNRVKNTRQLLLARQEIYCQVFEGDGPRFIRLFREAWTALPHGVKKTLLRYWRGYHHSPTIEFMGYWSGYTTGVIGHATLLGRHLRFHALSIDLASEADVRYVIAHELAHVLQWATGRMEGRRQAEYDANARALAWLGLRRRPRRTPALRDNMLAELVREKFKR